MTIKEAKAIDMVGYLSGRGYQPQKISGVNYWYLSPFRDENTASFKVNRKLNCWYDFGEGRGGDLLDFILTKDGGTIPDVLQKLADKIPDPIELPATEKKSMLLVKESMPLEIISTALISSFALVRYLDERRIHPLIADRYLKEVRYQNSNKTYYALGFKNDAGGYELRSPNFKASSSPKSSSHIKNNSTTLAVFEGFFDFLSYATICRNNPAPNRDFLILNSTSFFDQQLPLMQPYRQVHLYLDNDATGDKFTAKAIALDGHKFTDERSLYKPHKDLNEWLVEIGKPRTPGQERGER